MKGQESQWPQQEAFDYTVDKVSAKELPFAANSVKGSQFNQPMLEFSGACAGCVETAYAKLVTQLFGDRMYIANATGCSSIWGGSAPSTPYTVNKAGHGPAWGNSLFEDNAEFGLGIFLGQKAIRERLAGKLREMAETVTGELKEAIDGFFATYSEGAANKVATEKLVAALEKDGSEDAKYILKDKEFLAKKSIWIFGGDGWAYDIGFGGLDHVIASGEDVNILVLDTEVYSNTGGQSSKATPLGAIAKFAASGKRVRKKDLGMIATTYGYVYVAQIAMGADQAQTLKAIREAEAYPGPSLVIAYAPCINHGLKAGMGKSQAEEAKAVECGYWHLWRFNPALEDEGKNPFSLDSKEPNWEGFQDYLKGEVRFASVAKQYPAEAADLFAACEDMAKKRYASYKRMAAMDWSEEK